MLSKLVSCTTSVFCTQHKVPCRRLIWLGCVQRWVGDNLDKTFVRERQTALQHFLTAALDLYKREKSKQAAQVERFLCDKVALGQFCPLTKASTSAASLSGRPKVAANRQQVKDRRICLVGFMAVGKSSIAAQYAQGNYSDSYLPTIENTYHKTIQVNGEIFHTDVLDTAGQDEFSALNCR